MEERSNIPVNILLVSVLIVPHFLYSVSSFSSNSIILFHIVSASLAVFVLNRGLISVSALHYTLGSVLLAVLAVFHHKVLSQGSIIIAPLVVLITLSSLNKYGLDPRVLIAVYIVFVGYFWKEYYSRLPSFFSRPESFDEDAFVFERSSSNAIAISLNFLIWNIMYFNEIRQNWRIGKSYLVALNLVNAFLVLSQGSRGGIVVSVLLLIYSLVRRWKGKHSVILVSGIFGLLIANLDEVGLEEVRLLAQADFLAYANNDSWLFGPNLYRRFFAFDYSYNVFLDSWQRYTIFFALILLILWLRKGITSFKSKRFLLWIALSVIMVTERRFFPEYSDGILIYYMLKSV